MYLLIQPFLCWVRWTKLYSLSKIYGFIVDDCLVQVLEKGLSICPTNPVAWILSSFYAKTLIAVSNYGVQQGSVAKSTRNHLDLSAVHVSFMISEIHWLDINFCITALFADRAILGSHVIMSYFLCTRMASLAMPPYESLITLAFLHLPKSN